MAGHIIENIWYSFHEFLLVLCISCAFCDFTVVHTGTTEYKSAIENLFMVTWTLT